ncbi:hypothetical protein L3X38_015483 [Prunus dulcis]|uniref:Uncharacterized protein n=1 Tax=Prunus dulcis TaxID=3755 RepID=A0AAD4Z890_PRUDU|nr:hypothetical protein L3X38_015483 [Prunus dulcis]
MDDAMILEELIKIMVEKFSAIVETKNLNSSMKLCFHHLIELLKLGTDFPCCFEKGNPEAEAGASAVGAARLIGSEVEDVLSDLLLFLRGALEWSHQSRYPINS